MKFLFTNLFFFFLVISSSAQITIEGSDFTREVGMTITSHEVEASSITVPAEGENLTWDFSGAQLGGMTQFMVEPGSIPEIPEANTVSSTIDLFAGLVPQTFTFYELINDDQFSTLGRQSSYAIAPIGGLTGNAGDTLEILGNLSIYEAPSVRYQFPMNFGDFYTEEATITNDYVLTALNAGVNHVPGQFNGIIRDTTEVTGWGTLILPHPDGTGTVSMEALLHKNYDVTTDSIFLGGTEAPTALLNVFGLTQGGQNAGSTFYRFLAKGLPRSALFIEVNPDGQIIEAFIADDIRNLVSSNRNVAAASLPLRTFPNPTTGDFTIEFDKTDAQPWTFTLHNAMGQRLAEQLILAGLGATTFTPELTQQLAGGTYFFTLRDGSGQIVGWDKLSVQ